MNIMRESLFSFTKLKKRSQFKAREDHHTIYHSPPTNNHISTIFIPELEIENGVKREEFWVFNVDIVVLCFTRHKQTKYAGRGVVLVEEAKIARAFQEEIWIAARPNLNSSIYKIIRNSTTWATYYYSNLQYFKMGFCVHFSNLIIQLITIDMSYLTLLTWLA